MKILIITDEVWNDDLHGNNMLTNWFADFDAEFANIYCNPGNPKNLICSKYFQITDKMMMRSLLSGKAKAGFAFELTPEDISNAKGNFLGEQESLKLYRFLKSMSTESLRAIREFIWNYGRYDLIALKKFIDEFQPDIIFSTRMASIKILRLENIVYHLAQKPIVAFTGDAEYSMKLLRLSPIFWIKRAILRKKFREMMNNYSLYYTLSEVQKQEYEEEFGEKFKILRKCSDFNNYNPEKPIHKPIKITYAGKLYSKRWKTLLYLARALKEINKYEQRIVLEIYSKDKLSRRQLKILNDHYNTFYHGAIAPSELENKYIESDIALHVESFDIKNRLLTRVSFSTKIVDCIASGCAVMVISWKNHEGFIYLKKEDAAFTIGNQNHILHVLEKIVNSPQLIAYYSEKAYICGKCNHSKENVQDQIQNDFNEIIKHNSKDKGAVNENNSN